MKAYRSNVILGWMALTLVSTLVMNCKKRQGIKPTESSISGAETAQDVCGVLRSQSLNEKIETLIDRQAASVGSEWIHNHGGGGEWDNIGHAIVKGGGEAARATLDSNRDTYLKDFIGTHSFTWHSGIGLAKSKIRTVAAFAATAKFLNPSTTENHGYKTLKSTFESTCEFFPKAETKKVHALGTLGFASLALNKKLMKLDQSNRSTGIEVDNPWTGLFSYESNYAQEFDSSRIPVLVRLSIANPIFGHPERGDSDESMSVMDGKRLIPEFIPGAAFKFIIDSTKSVDLVAMDSLAGQGADQNFFKYEFSPDFSANAPEAFNTETDGGKLRGILARYSANPVNNHLMGLVGSRFTAALEEISRKKFTDADKHAKTGPHPFMMSIEQLAAVDVYGRAVAKEKQRRPWRLIFAPHLNFDDSEQAGGKERFERARSAARLTHGRPETDFRYKLAGLANGDKVFDVIGQTKSGDRYLIGYIRLVKPFFPSEFSDGIYFSQHSPELGRMGGAATIIDP